MVPRVCSEALIESAMEQDGSSPAAARCAPAGPVSCTSHPRWAHGLEGQRVADGRGTNGTTIVTVLFNASKNSCEFLSSGNGGAVDNADVGWEGVIK